MADKSRSGDLALLGIIASDFFGALAGATVHLTLIWWVLGQGTSATVVSLMILAIFVPMNLGVLFSGWAVARMGARRLLLISKSVALLGAFACFVLLASGQLSLWALALISTITYGAMGPSLTADLARVPALARMANRPLAVFHAGNGISMVLGQVGGLVLAGVLMDAIGMAQTVLIGCVLVVVSLFITWISFPRDRLGSAPTGSFLTVTRDLAVTVFHRVMSAGILHRALILVGVIIAVSEGISEVFLPLVIRENGLPATTLSSTMIALVAASIVGSLLAPAISKRFALNTVMGVATGLTALLFISALSVSHWMVITGFIALIVGVATLAGTLASTAIQEEMPNALQAQAMGLWQSTVLAASAVAIFLAGALA